MVNIVTNRSLPLPIESRTGTGRFRPPYFRGTRLEILQRIPQGLLLASYGSLPAPIISAPSRCATAGYACRFLRRRSPGNCDRVSHNPAATAAAHVIEIRASRNKSAVRLPCPVSGRGTTFATSKLNPAATTAVQR